MAGWWLGKPGALVRIPSPHVAPGLDAPRQRKTVVHDLLGDGARVNLMGRTRRYVLRWNPALTADELGILQQLELLPGPLRIIDPTRRNMLTGNQSTGTDELRDATGMVARIQGILVTDTAQARSGLRSAKWDSQGAVTANKGPLFCYPNPLVVDKFWLAVLPNTQYSFSCYARASQALTVAGQFDWHTSLGGYIGTNQGNPVALSLTDWSTRPFVTATSPANVAYGIGSIWSTTGTGSTVNVWVDDLMVNEGPLAAWVPGGGTQQVSIEHFDPRPRGSLFGPELTLVEAA
jgi:hypothetical protein